MSARLNFESNQDPTDLRHEQVANFTESLRSNLPVIKWSPEVHLDSNNPVELAIYNETIDHKTAGIHFDTSLFDTISALHGRPSVSVDFFPRRARTGQNSMHGVFFGDLKLAEDITIGVAVKPHKVENNEVSALKDLLSLYTADKLGFYTLKPAGLVLLEGDRRHQTAYSMTLLNESLTTFDTINWSKFACNTSENPGMRQLWRTAANQIALLHSSGQIAHGDLAARNIATADDGGSFLIDWEKAQFTGIAPRDAETRYQFSYQDISALLESMARSPYDHFKPGIGLLNGEIEDWWSAFSEVFLDDYMETRLLLSQEGKQSAQRISDVNSELSALERSLREDCAMFREIYEAAAAA